MSDWSFWEKEIFLRKYDLIVVGAGITGLSAALFYKQSNPSDSVLVLEKGTKPTGASTRSAGFACIGSITEHRADIENSSEERVKQRLKRRFEGLKLLKSMLGEQQIGYERCGGYELFTSEQKFQEVSQQVERFNYWLSELIGEREVYTGQTLNGYPVIYNRLEGALHPGMMMNRLIRLVKEAGVEIRWNCEVEQIDEAEVRLKGGGGFKAGQILIAANGFVRKLIPSVGIDPARGYVMLTNPIDDLAWKGTFNYDRGYIYFRNVGDRVLLGGARNIALQEESTDRFGINPKVKSYLTDFAADVLKLPSGWNIDHEWSGIMGFTENKDPVIDRVSPGVVVAGGLSGMGIAIGMEVGNKAAGMLHSKSE